MEALKVLLFFSIVPISFAVANLWWWMWFFIAVGVILALFELVSVLRKGRTLSQQFWDYTDTKKKIIIVVCWLIFAVYLAVHLLFRL